MIDAMKLALAKFEHLWEIGIDAEYKVELLPEIKALRQAIEQAEKDRTLQEVSDIGQEIEQEKMCVDCGKPTMHMGNKCYGCCQTTQTEQEPVASIYISINGDREFDDWNCALPIGRNELYAAPVKREQAEKQEPVAVWELQEGGWNTIADADWMETLSIGTKLYTAPVKRPVKSYTGGEPQYATETPDDLLRQSEREGWRYAKECEAEIKRLKELAEYRLQLLMKMPENKSWQGLTDEDIDDIAKNYALNNPTTPTHFARAIEAKLKEKNAWVN
jgi:hypothetical protein